MNPDPRRARLEELLGIEATQPLSPGEAAELDTLLAAFPDEDPDAYELAAAAIHIALIEREEMPARLADRLDRAGMVAAFAPPATSPRTPARSRAPG